MTESDYKRCTICLEVKLLDCFHRDKTTKDGYYPTCKECISKIRRDKYQKNPEKYKEQAKRGRLKNPEKHKETSKQYRLAHPDEMREYRKEWIERNPEKDRQSKKEWEKNNPEKIRDRAKRHRQKNPELYMEYKHRRRSKENELPYTMTQADWDFMFEYWNGKCAICGREVTETLIIARDHWIPIRDKQERNIGTTPENMLPLCHSKDANQNGCNSSKSNKDPIAWLYSRYSRDEADMILTAIKQYFEIVRLRKTND